MLGLFSRKLNSLSSSVMSTEILIKADVRKEILEEALKIAQDYEEKLSAYKSNSYISRINSKAGKDMVYCPEDVVEIIKKSLEIAEKTAGLFDPTVGSLTQGLYGFGTKREKIPTKEEIEKAKNLVDYRKVLVSGNFVYLEKEGMRLDLGGIAKGWVSQKLAEFLIDSGASQVLVSIGGEICCFGRRWKIGIKNPSGELLGLLETLDKPTTISTSGSYERYILKEEYHHILNPRKGEQERFYRSLTLVENGFVGAELDAFATAFFNIPPEKLKEIFRSFICVDCENNIYIGNMLRQKVKALHFLLNE